MFKGCLQRGWPAGPEQETGRVGSECPAHLPSTHPHTEAQQGLQDQGAHQGGNHGEWLPQEPLLQPGDDTTFFKIICILIILLKDLYFTSGVGFPLYTMRCSTCITQWSCRGIVGDAGFEPGGLLTLHYLIWLFLSSSFLYFILYSLSCFFLKFFLNIYIYFFFPTKNFSRIAF